MATLPKSGSLVQQALAWLALLERRLAWLVPISVFVSCLMVVLVPYSLAVRRGRVRPLLPSISESGCCPPESTVFLMLSIVTAVCGSLNIRLAYSRLGDGGDRHLRTLGVVSALSGYLGLVGVACVTLVDSLVGHFTLAALTFLCTLVGCASWTALAPSRGLRRLRRNLTALTALTLGVACVSCCLLSKDITALRQRGCRSCGPAFYTEALWSWDNPGYWVELTFAGSEWLLCLLIGVYNLTNVEVGSQGQGRDKIEMSGPTPSAEQVSTNTRRDTYRRTVRKQQ